MSKPEAVEIPTHITRVYDGNPTATCSCGWTETADPDGWAHDLAEAHTNQIITDLLRRITPEQLAAALYAGARNQSQIIAAVALLVEHQHWMRFGHLRKHISGGWNLAGELLLRIDWNAVGEALDAGDIHGSTSELIVLRFATSMFGRAPIRLDDLYSLDGTNKALVITALSHMLTHGGETTMKAAAPTWYSYRRTRQIAEVTG